MLSRRRQVITAIFAITSITIFIYQIIQASHTEVPFDQEEAHLTVPLFAQYIDTSTTHGGGKCDPTSASLFRPAKRLPEWKCNVIKDPPRFEPHRPDTT